MNAKIRQRSPDLPVDGTFLITALPVASVFPWLFVALLPECLLWFSAIKSLTFYVQQFSHLSGRGLTPDHVKDSYYYQSNQHFRLSILFVNPYFVGNGKPIPIVIFENYHHESYHRIVTLVQFISQWSRFSSD